MRSALIRAVAFVLYQLSLLAGIALFPVAVAVGQLGVTLPVHRAVETTGSVYERAGSQ